MHLAKGGCPEFWKPRAWRPFQPSPPPPVPPALSCIPQPGPVTEVDGAVATDFFTVLSTGQRFTEDQWLNVQAFSMLRPWLLLRGPESPGAPDTGGTRRAPGGPWPPKPSPVGTSIPVREAERSLRAGLTDPFTQLFVLCKLSLSLDLRVSSEGQAAAPDTGHWAPCLG